MPRTLPAAHEDLLSRLPPRLIAVVVCVGGAIAIGVGVALNPLLGVAALGTVVLAAVVVRRPVLAAGLLALVPTISGLRPGIPVPGLRLGEVMIVALALMLIVAVPKWRLRRWDVIDWLALAYVSTSAALGFWDAWAAHRGTLNLDTVVGPVQFFILFRGVRTALAWMPLKRLFLRVMLIASVPMTVVAFLQYFAFPGVRSAVVSLTGVDSLATPGYTAVTRASGLFTQAHLLAGYQVVILLIVASLLLTPGAGVMGRRGLWIVLVSSLVGLLLSLTATAIIGAILGLLVIGIRSGKARLLAKWGLPVALAAGILFSPLIASRVRAQTYRAAGSDRSSLVPQTIAFRITVWENQYVPVIKGHLSTGWGSALPPSITWHYSESLYLTLLLRGGVPLLAVYLALMLAMAAAAGRPAGDPTTEAACHALWALIIALLPMHILFPYFVTDGLPQAFWILAAVALTPSVPQLAHDGPDRQPLPVTLVPAT